MVSNRIVFTCPLFAVILLTLGVACGGDPEEEPPGPTASPSASGTTGTANGEAATEADSGTDGQTPTASAGQPSSTSPDRSQSSVMAEPGEKLSVVTTSNIVADWIREVGGDRVEVLSLLPSNADPHTYQPGAQDIARVADADLVLSIGLSLEGGWLDKLIENAARDPDVIVALGKTVDPIDIMEIFDEHAVGYENEAVQEGDQDEEEPEEDNHGQLDPHFWLDPLRVKQAVSSIAALFSRSDPEGRTLYRGNAIAYNQQLDSLHAWIEEQVGSLPEDHRVLITSHDSFQYFAQRYGFEVAGAIFPVSTDAEPTAKDLAELIEVIEHEGVPAVFTEHSHTERLARRVSEETGAELIGGLYTGSLGEEGGEAGTYLYLMRHNTNIIVEALK